MERIYTASFDNGHDYINVTYTSSHRANSQQNKQDAINALRRKKGIRCTNIRNIVKEV